MHRLLAIQDVLDEIFSWLPQHELIAVAQVNSSWFKFVLPSIWREVELADALSTLGEACTSNDKDKDDISREFDVSQWEHFHLYAYNVRTLLVLPKSIPILQTIVLGLPKPANQLFPNTQHLHLVIDSTFGSFDPDIYILIPPTVQHVRVSTDSLLLPHFSALSSALTTCQPDLRALQLEFRQELEEPAQCQQLFIELLTIFANSLTSIKIPRYLNTPVILEALSRLPRLSELIINSVGDLDLERTTPSKCVNGDVPFASIQDLEYGGCPQAFQSVFFRSSPLASLTSLYIDLDPLDLDNIASFVVAIVYYCPQLELLSIDSFAPEAIALTSDDVDALPNLPWQVIKPLLASKKLEHLQLCCFTVSIDIDQLTELLTNRPTWKSLTLYTEEPLHIADMLLFAKYCPQLGDLGVRIDSYHGLGPFPNITPDIKFPFLRHISFGPSIVEYNEIPDIARFLFEVCSNPPFLWGQDAMLWDAVAMRIAEFYIQEHTNTGKRPTQIVQIYTDHQTHIQKKRRDANPWMGVNYVNEEHFDLDHDTMGGEGSPDMDGSFIIAGLEDEAIDEGMMVDDEHGDD